MTAAPPGGWDARYAGADYLFGTEPARFLVEQSGHLAGARRVLVVADGEGRNSVWLAEQGLDVTAFDASSVAVGKARALAARRGVSADLRVADIDAWEWGGGYDAVVAVFIQFATPVQRATIFEGMKRALRPGGLLLLHGYRPEQLGYGTGGPPDAGNMYTKEMLREAFGDMTMLRLVAYDRDIREGRGHAGMSALIDLVARKPA